MKDFCPVGERARSEQYLRWALGAPVTLFHAERLAASSREAPWRLDVSLEGERRSYVLRLDARFAGHEYQVLRAMEAIPIPTPRVYGWDEEGEALGVPAFLSDFVEGESLLGPLRAGEAWAEDLYLETVCSLQSVSRDQVASVAHVLDEGESAADVLAGAHAFFEQDPDPLVEAAHTKLKETMPALPALCFSNGDLWPDNILVRGQRLAGIIDWQHAGFSDPIFELLLAFFVAQDLRGRRLEERYCRRMGFDPLLLPWYRAMELFDTLHWVERTGSPFEQHSSETLRADLQQWLDGESPSVL